MDCDASSRLVVAVVAFFAVAGHIGLYFPFRGHAGTFDHYRCLGLVDARLLLGVGHMSRRWLGKRDDETDGHILVFFGPLGHSERQVAFYVSLV